MIFSLFIRFLYRKQSKVIYLMVSRPTNQSKYDFARNSFFAPKIGYFRCFFGNLSILVEYSTGVEYSEGSQNNFLNQEIDRLQNVFYGFVIRRLVFELQKIGVPPPTPSPIQPFFWGWVGGGRLNVHFALCELAWDFMCKKVVRL